MAFEYFFKKATCLLIHFNPVKEMFSKMADTKCGHASVSLTVTLTIATINKSARALLLDR